MNFLIIKSGDHVWTRGEVWSADGVPYLLTDLATAQRELSRAEMYRREEYAGLNEAAKIVSVSLVENH